MYVLYWTPGVKGLLTLMLLMIWNQNINVVIESKVNFVQFSAFSLTHNQHG